MSLTIIEAMLVLELLQPLFYGIFVVSFGFCLHYLLRDANGIWKPYREISRSMLAAALLLCCFATFDVFLGFSLNFKAHTRPQGNPEEVFLATGNWMNVMGSVNVIAQTILGDCMLIYRCWIIYNMFWRYVIPSIVLAIAGLVCVALTIYYECTMPPDSHLQAPLRQIITTLWALSIAVNVLTTYLIVIRIWKSDRRIARLAGPTGSITSDNGMSVSHPIGGKNFHAIKIIVESGMLYTTVVVITAISFMVGHNLFVPLSGVDVQVIGIAFNLIIIRANRHSQVVAREFRNVGHVQSLRFANPRTTSYTTPSMLEAASTDSPSVPGRSSVGKMEYEGSSTKA